MQPCARSAIGTLGMGPLRLDYSGVLLCKERRKQGRSAVRPSRIQIVSIDLSTPYSTIIVKSNILPCRLLPYLYPSWLWLSYSESEKSSPTRHIDTNYNQTGFHSERISHSTETGIYFVVVYNRLSLPIHVWRLL